MGRHSHIERKLAELTANDPMLDGSHQTRHNYVRIWMPHEAGDRAMVRFGTEPRGLFARSRPGCQEQPTAFVGVDAWRLARDVDSPIRPIREDLTRERPTVAVSADVRYWAAMTSRPSQEKDGRSSAAICGTVRLPSRWRLAAISAASSAVLLTIAYYGERLMTPRIDRHPANRETQRRRVDRILAELRDAERRAPLSVDGWVKDVRVGVQAALRR